MSTTLLITLSSAPAWINVSTVGNRPAEAANINGV